MNTTTVSSLPLLLLAAATVAGAYFAPAPQTVVSTMAQSVACGGLVFVALFSFFGSGVLAKSA